MENEKKYLLNIISAVLKGSAVPYASGNIDYDVLLSIAKKQELTNIICTGLEDAFLPQEMVEAQKKIAKAKERSFNDFSYLLDEIKLSGIPFVQMGGLALRGLYSDPSWRESRDYDIMIRPADMISVTEIALKNGFSFIRECKECCYFAKEPDVRVAVRTGFYGMNIRAKVVKSGDEYTLSPEDRYICSLYSLKKEIESGKGQLKLLVDVFVLKFAFDTFIECDYVKSELERLELTAFETKINQMYRALFLNDKNASYDEELFSHMFDNFKKKLPPKYISPEKEKSIKRIKISLFSSGIVCAFALIVCMALFFNNEYSFEMSSDEISVFSEEESTEVSEESDFILFGDGMYYGESENGVPNGNGKLCYNSGDIYSGEFDHGVREGYGVLNFYCGDKYEGNFHADSPFGEGTMYYSNGDCISGNFTEWSEVWRPTGDCVYKRKIENGYDEYIGKITAGVISGEWKVTYANGDVYEGIISDGKKNGTGKYVWSNGGTFNGEWKNDIPSEGTFKDSYGTYTGSFVNGLFSGNGKYVFANGDVYEGGFSGGKENGDGVLKYKNGEKYEGKFVNGVFSGKGKMYFLNGDQVEGNFKNGKLDGEARYYYKAQNVWQTVVYADGKIVEYKKVVK